MNLKTIWSYTWDRICINLTESFKSGSRPTKAAITLFLPKHRLSIQTYYCLVSALQWWLSDRCPFGLQVELSLSFSTHHLPRNIIDSYSHKKENEEFHQHRWKGNFILLNMALSKIPSALHRKQRSVNYGRMMRVSAERQIVWGGCLSHVISILKGLNTVLSSLSKLWRFWLKSCDQWEKYLWCWPHLCIIIKYNV